MPSVAPLGVRQALLPGHQLRPYQFTEDVDRQGLIEALDCSGAVYEAARRALRGGADFEVYPGPVRIEDVRSIYRRREAHVRAEGLVSLGFAEAVNALDLAGAETVLFGYVRQGDWHFQLFLDAETEAAIACLGIRQR